MSGHSNLIVQLTQQNRIIHYLQEKHLQNTGYSISLPQSWQDFLKVSDNQTPILDPTFTKETLDKYAIEKEERKETFLQALSNLNLPQKLPEASKKNSSSANMSIGKRSVQMTNFNPASPYHMIEIINLSNFVNRKFTKAGFRELVESINDMRCLSSIILQNNGINESHQDELDALFLNKRLTNIDLSRNNIDKATILKLAKILKDNISHIEWLDLSRNDFSHDIPALNALISGLRCQKNLYHLALDANLKYNSSFLIPDKKYAGSESITRLSQRLRSLTLVDSKVTAEAMKSVEIALQSPSCHVISLNFQFCFLDSRCMHILSKGLEVNRSLIRLDLSNNGLAPISGIYLVKSLNNNISLHELNLANNNLTDDFAKVLAKTLRDNDVLWKVDIAYNPIGIEGAKELIMALKENNDTLESLGNIEVNIQMGINNLQELRKHLKINEFSKDLRRKIIENQKNKLGNDPKSLSSTEIKTTGNYLDSEFDDFKLLKPLIFTNNPYIDTSEFKLWNV